MPAAYQSTVNFISELPSMQEYPERSNSPISVRKSSKRYFERRIMHAWKAMTRATHKQPRASFVPPDFVLVTKRRSIMHLSRADLQS